MISQEQIAHAKILIVDDQKLHSLFLKDLLIQNGYQHVEAVNDPLKAIPFVKEFQPDLLILDLVMPQLDGFQIMGELHDFRDSHYLPILAVSPEKSPDIRLHALQSGATDILVRPYENIEVIFRIRNMVEMRILQVALERQNKILELKVLERTKELRESQLDVIQRLAHAAEFRDKTTGVHIIRMSHYAMKLGEAVGFSEADCELLLSASPLHDVGKLGIPDSILLKPGPLTADEYEIMKTHTTIGAQLLAGSPSPMMKMAQTIALTHHEKWDGTGYPYKLRGEAIPLVGQVCGLCDVFDALTSERPYKKAWSVKETVKELIAQKGKHFNPALADRFLTILPEIERLKNRMH